MGVTVSVATGYDTKVLAVTSDKLHNPETSATGRVAISLSTGRRLLVRYVCNPSFSVDGIPLGACVFYCF